MKRVITYHDSSIKAVKKKLKELRLPIIENLPLLDCTFFQTKKIMLFVNTFFNHLYISHTSNHYSIFFYKNLKNSNPNRELIYVAEKVCSCRPFPNPRNNLIVPHVPSRSTKSFLVFQFLLFKCRL